MVCFRSRNLKAKHKGVQTVLLSHTWGLFAHPYEEWETIQQEQTKRPKLYLFYLLVLSAIPPISGFIGATQVGWQIGGGDVTKLTVESTIPLCIISYFGIVSGIVVTGIAIDWMRDTYTDLTKQQMSGIVMATYITMPLIILSVVGMYPVIWLGFIALLIGAGYSSWLLYSGVPIVFKISKERGMMFASSILTFALVMAVILLISTVIIWSVGFEPVFTN